MKRRIVAEVRGTKEGVTFNVALIRRGERYGREDSIQNDSGPLVEFYDTRYPHTPHGQFVARYYLSTLSSGLTETRGGLCLHGGVPDWEMPHISFVTAVLASIEGL